MSTMWLWAEAPPTRWRMRSCSQAVCSGRDSDYHTPGHGWKGLPAHTGGCQWTLTCSRWQFASDGGDIGFGIFLKTRMGERQKAGEMTEVLPNQRYNSHMVPEDGSLTCLKTGVCKSFKVSCSCLCDRKKASYLGPVWSFWVPSTSNFQGGCRDSRVAVFRVFDLECRCEEGGALYNSQGSELRDRQLGIHGFVLFYFILFLVRGPQKRPAQLSELQTSQRGG